MNTDLCRQRAVKLANESQPAPAKLRLRHYWLAAGWSLVFLIIYLSLTPEPVQLNVEQGDKYGHVLAYAALMSWFANIYQLSLRRLQFALGFVALGIALEFVQGWTGYRSFELADMAADAAGVAAGWVCADPRIPNYLRWTERMLARG
jgi:VanZ family protein